MNRHLVFVVALLGLSCVASSAAASGFEFARFGADRAHAASTSAFANYYNPAALAAAPHKLQLAGDFMLGLHGASYDRTASSVPEPSDAPGSNLGRAKLFNVLGGPALAASFRLKDLALGFSALAPFTGAAKWGGNGAYDGNSMYPGAQDGTARWHIIQGGLQSIYFTASAAYRFPRIGLSVGASANLIYSSVRYLRAADATLDDSLPSEGRINVKASGVTGSFGLGVLQELWAERLWLGISYQAPPGLYRAMALDGTVDTNFSKDGKPSSTRATLHQSLPDIIRLALRYKDPARNYELRLFGGVERWSRFKNQCATQRGASCDLASPANIISAYPRNWHNAWNLYGGGNYFFSQQWEGYATLGYDSGAIPLGMLEASVIDGKQISAQLGGRYYLGTRAAFSLAYSYSYWLPRDASGKSRLDQVPSGSPLKLPTGDGKYTQWLGMFNAFIEIYFDGARAP